MTETFTIPEKTDRKLQLPTIKTLQGWKRVGDYESWKEVKLLPLKDQNKSILKLNSGTYKNLL